MFFDGNPHVKFRAILAIKHLVAPAVLRI